MGRYRACKHPNVHLMKVSVARQPGDKPSADGSATSRMVSDADRRMAFLQCERLRSCAVDFDHKTLAERAVTQLLRPAGIGFSLRQLVT